MTKYDTKIFLMNETNNIHGVFQFTVFRFSEQFEIRKISLVETWKKISTL